MPPRGRKGTVDFIERKDLKSKLGRGKPLTVKVGFDPTAPDIHLGHGRDLEDEALPGERRIRSSGTVRPKNPRRLGEMRHWKDTQGRKGRVCGHLLCCTAPSHNQPLVFREPALRDGSSVDKALFVCIRRCLNQSWATYEPRAPKARPNVNNE